MPKKFSVHDVLGGDHDKEEDDKETRHGVGGSGRGGGSDQQVVGWGRAEWEKAKADGAVSEEAFQDAIARGEFNADDEFRFRITFWKSPPGSTYFSVNDGPLRGVNDDPADEAFLKAIRDERRCPDELMAQAQNKDPVVDLADKTSEEYKEPPKPKYVKFSGDGMSLGGAAKVEIDKDAPVMEVDYEFKLDESIKTTKLQLAFHDGTKKTQKFNLHHTVHDIRMWMESQKPLPFGTTWQLSDSYDKKVLEDMSLTIEAGKLKGASLLQGLV